MVLIDTSKEWIQAEDPDLTTTSLSWIVPNMHHSSYTADIPKLSASNRHEFSTGWKFGEVKTSGDLDMATMPKKCGVHDSYQCRCSVLFPSDITLKWDSHCGLGSWRKRGRWETPGVIRSRGWHLTSDREKEMVFKEELQWTKAWR